MATLQIDISSLPLGRGEYANDESLPAAFVARAKQLLDAHGVPPHRPEFHEFAVSLGGRPSELEVSPGLWGIELSLPSGELLSQQKRIQDHGAESVHFDIGSSPHEWLAWQYAEGSVPEQNRYAAMLAGDGSGVLQSPRGVTMRGYGTTRSLTTRLQKSFNAPVIISDSFALGATRQRQSASQVTLLRFELPPAPNPDDEAEKFALAKRLWSKLVAGLRLEASILDLPGLSEDQVDHFEQGGDDPWHQTWRFTPQAHDAARRFAMVVTSRAIELASLPLPWEPGQGVVDGTLLELIIDKSEVARPSRTSVTLRDQNFFGLLSYLKTGALALAARIAEQNFDYENMLVEMLQGKRRNPLAACAAGYALLGGSDLSQPKHWHKWLKNLSTWFREIPDGAILQGRYLLASGSGTRAEVKQEYLRAFRRGLPFYTLGLTWLLEGLRQFDDPEKDADCIEAARLVRQVALRSDVSQVFTVVRFHAPTEISSQGAT